MPSTYQQIVDDLNAQSFHKVVLTCTQEQIERAINAFFHFMELPEETRKRFSFKLGDDSGDMEVGYHTRSRANGNPDNRGYFQYSVVGDEEFRKTGSDCPELIAFLDAAKVVYDATVPTMREVVHVIDEAHPGIEQKIFDPGPGRILRIPLRFLGYPTTEPGDFLASGHYDKGATTIAIAESAPGLRIGKLPETVKDVVHEVGYGLFFPGIQLAHFTNETFAPSWHDVAQKDQDAYKPGFARWAVVLFCGAWDGKPTTWADRHTPQY